MRTTPNKRNNVIYERIYELILYQEDIDNGILENNILENIKGRYAMVYHDKDIKEDGTPKKPHYHMILWFDREKSINQVSKMFNFPINRIDWKADIYGTIQYLIHKNDTNKYQYDASTIQTNIENISEYLYPKKEEKPSETDDLRVIMTYIQNHITGLRLYDIYCFCIDNDCWSSYRRNYSIIKDILMEERYIDKEHKLVRTLYDDNKINRQTGEVTIV